MSVLCVVLPDSISSASFLKYFDTAFRKKFLGDRKHCATYVLCDTVVRDGQRAHHKQDAADDKQDAAEDKQHSARYKQDAANCKVRAATGKWIRPAAMSPRRATNMIR